MSSDKIVDMAGNPIEPVGESDPKIREALERAIGEVAGETHTGVGIVLVDAMGRVGTKFFWKAGFAHSAISGAALLQRRMIDDYEAALPTSGSGSNTDGAA